MFGSVLFALPFIAHAYAGTASRWVGDDYCASYIFRDHGLLGGQRWFYANWGAEPTTLLLMALTDGGGPRLAAILPAIAIVLWLATATWAIRRMSSLIGNAWSWPVSFLVAEVLVFATLQDTPNVIQSLYLRVPMFAYTGSLVAATAYAGVLAWLARAGIRPSVSWALSAGVAFLAGAASPVYVAVQTTALGLGALGAALARTRSSDSTRRAVGLFASGALGSVAALAFVALAPGNAVRQAYFVRPHGILTVGMWSVLDAIFMFARPLLPLLQSTIARLAPLVFGATPAWLQMALDMGTSPLTPIVTVSIPAVLVFSITSARAVDDHRRQVNVALAWLPVVVFILVAACMAPSAYGTSTPPPPRALIVPGFAIVCCAIVWGAALGARLRMLAFGRGPRLIATAALALIALGQITTSTISTARQGRELRAWAARWDVMDRELRAQRAAGSAAATVAVVGSVGGVGSIAVDPADWVNGCAARYYGFTSITGVTGTVARP